ncbi:MAG: hypothetical protein Q9208_004700 [Pyrenodesmia sp. 3 TL-2023]
MPCPVDADLLPQIPRALKNQLRGQAYDQNWLQRAQVTDAQVHDYLERNRGKPGNHLQAHLKDLCRNDTMAYGDELHFVINRVVWIVFLIDSPTMSTFSVQCVTPATGIRAMACEGMLDMTRKLLQQHLNDPDHEGFGLNYNGFEVWRGWRRLGNLCFVRTARAMYDKIMSTP